MPRKLEPGFGEDRFGHAERQGDDDRAEDVWQEMDARDTALGGSEGSRGDDVVGFALPEELGASQAADRNPARDGDGEQHIAKATSEDRQQHDGEEHPRKCPHGIDQSHDDEVDVAAAEARGHAQCDADRQRERLGAEADREGGPGAVDDAGKEISADPVGAHEVLARGELPRGRKVRLVVGERGDDRGADRQHEQEEHDRQPKGPEAIGAEATPSVAERRCHPRIAGGDGSGAIRMRNSRQRAARVRTVATAGRPMPIRKA